MTRAYPRKSTVNKKFANRCIAASKTGPPAKVKSGSTSTFSLPRANPITINESLKDDSKGPGLLDLLSLHFRDDGYITSVHNKYDAENSFIDIDVTHLLTLKKLPSRNAQFNSLYGKLRFVYRKNSNTMSL